MEQIESKQPDVSLSQESKVKSEDNEEFVKIEDLPLEDSKPGQRYPTPSPGFADRVFYETLLKQRPDSHMAQEWCVAYGILSTEHAHELWQEICRRKASGRRSIKSPVKSSSNNSSSKRAKSSRSLIIDDGEADTGFDNSGVFETQGATGL